MKAEEFWNKQPPTIEGVLLRQDASKVDSLERQEILALLPALEQKVVLDLAAGIGRFTQEFAKTASSVTSVDVAADFMEKNRRDNSAFQNIAYLTANAMDLQFAEGTFDLIFINWLFMYLEDEEVKELAIRLKAWLKPGGTLFFRESCAAVTQRFRDSYPVNYRAISFYHRIVDPLLTLKDAGSIQVFIDRYANPFHCYWVYTR
jgi:phosphoethanolamine N-methyltransferase